MKCLWLTLFAVALSHGLPPSVDKKVQFDKNGEILITDDNGRLIHISKSKMGSPDKNIDITVSGPNMPTKKIQINEHNKVIEQNWDNYSEETRYKRSKVEEYKQKHQAVILGEVIKEFLGIIDQKGYEKFLKKLQSRDLDHEVYEIFCGLTAQPSSQDVQRGLQRQIVQKLLQGNTTIQQGTKLQILQQLLLQQNQNDVLPIQQQIVQVLQQQGVQSISPDFQRQIVQLLVQQPQQFPQGLYQNGFLQNPNMAPDFGQGFYGTGTIPQIGINSRLWWNNLSLAQKMGLLRQYNSQIQQNSLVGQNPIDQNPSGFQQQYPASNLGLQGNLGQSQLQNRLPIWQNQYPLYYIDQQGFGQGQLEGLNSPLVHQSQQPWQSFEPTQIQGQYSQTSNIVPTSQKIRLLPQGNAAYQPHKSA